MLRIIALLAMGLGAAALAAAAPQIGQPAPDFAVVDSNGQQRTLAEFSDDLVVLEWTNHDCPFVVRHYNTGHMQTLQRQYTDRDVVWLSVISSAPRRQGHVAPARANELTESRDAHPTAVLLDESGVMGRSYDARTTPHMYIIDQGTLVYMGGIDGAPMADPMAIPQDQRYFANAMGQVLDGQSVTRPTSRPYGCSIKYDS
ncbi:MAG: redoxin domain-containing protein [Candidatus Competibacterales bacterium]